MKLRFLLFFLLIFLSSCAYPYLEKDNFKDEREIEETKPILETNEVAKLTPDQQEISKILLLDQFGYINSFDEEKRSRFQEYYSPTFLIIFHKNPPDEVLDYLNYTSGLGIEFKPASEGLIVNPSNFFHVKDPQSGKGARYLGLSDFQKLNQNTVKLLVYSMTNSLHGWEEKITLVKVNDEWKITKREDLVDY